MNSITRSPSARQRWQATAWRRAGVMLPVALLCCAACALILTALIGQVARRIRAARTNEHATQCFWLAQSALQHARLRLQQDAKYPGQTWNVAEGQPLPRAGRAHIQVDRRDGLLWVDVLAEYPLDEDAPVRRRVRATWLAAPSRDVPPRPAADNASQQSVDQQRSMTPSPSTDPAYDGEVQSNQQPTPGDRPPRPPFSSGDTR